MMDYTYFGVGGWSWAIPYFAGLCTLALEINPQLTYEQMQNALKETKSETESGYYVINPVDYIKKLESPKQLILIQGEKYWRFMSERND